MSKMHETYQNIMEAKNMNDERIKTHEDCEFRSKFEEVYREDGESEDACLNVYLDADDSGRACKGENCIHWMNYCATMEIKKLLEKIEKSIELKEVK